MCRKRAQLIIRIWRKRISFLRIRLSKITNNYVPKFKITFKDLAELIEVILSLKRKEI